MLDEIHANRTRFEYTKAHIEELKSHPHLLNAQQCVEQFQEVSKPLTFKSSYWLMQSLTLTSMHDMETFYKTLHIYFQTFSTLQPFMQGSAKTNPSSSPWILLVKLEELISKI